MIFSTVQHISSMDKLVPCTTHPQLHFCVAQNYLPSAGQTDKQINGLAKNQLLYVFQ